ncbi:hypothetical protein ACHAPT_011789 [Fusarium lateritium]
MTPLHFIPPAAKTIMGSTFIAYDNEKSISHVLVSDHSTGGLQISKNSLILAIHGSCRSSGGTPTQSSWGVYFGPDSPYNSGKIVPGPFPQTTAYAEIQALKVALVIVRNILYKYSELSAIYIRTSSKYLVEMMTEFLEPCIQHGWRVRNGEFVPYAETWDWISDLRRHMQHGHGRAIALEFEHLEPANNLDAEALANHALDAAAPAAPAGLEISPGYLV